MMARLIPAALVLVALAWAGPAAAHGVHTTFLSGPAVAMTVSFEDGSPMSFEEFEAIPPGDDTPFQIGRTDRLGRVVFQPDRAGTWTVRVWSEDGHGTVVEIPVGEDMLPSGGDNSPQVSQVNRIVTGVAVLFGIFGLVTMFTARRSS